MGHVSLQNIFWCISSVDNVCFGCFVANAIKGQRGALLAWTETRAHATRALLRERRRRRVQADAQRRAAHVKTGSGRFGRPALVFLLRPFIVKATGDQRQRLWLDERRPIASALRPVYIHVRNDEQPQLLRKMARTKQTARLWHLRSAEWLVCLLSKSEFAEKILEIFSFTWTNRQSEPSVKICGFTQQRHYRVDYTHRKKNRSTKDPPLVPQHLPRRNRCGILFTLFTWTRFVWLELIVSNFNTLVL